MLYNGYAFDGIAWIFGPLCMKLSSTGIDFSPLLTFADAVSAPALRKLFASVFRAHGLVSLFKSQGSFLFLFFFQSATCFFLFPPPLMRFPCDVKTTRKKKGIV